MKKIFFFISLIFSAEAQVIVKEASRIILTPEPLKPYPCYVDINEDGLNRWALVLPEIIGCSEQVILNQPKDVKWQKSNDQEIVEGLILVENKISVSVKLIPFNDYVDAEMTIKNLTATPWHEVWSFNCLSPVLAKGYRDSALTRTYLSYNNSSKLLSETKRTIGPRPTIDVYYGPKAVDNKYYPSMSDFRATSPEKSDNNYLVTLNSQKDSYMAATSPEAMFLFHNSEYKCIHSCPYFGDIQPNNSATVKSRFYFAKGNLSDFEKRYKQDKREGFK